MIITVGVEKNPDANPSRCIRCGRRKELRWVMYEGNPTPVCEPCCDSYTVRGLYEDDIQWSVEE